MSNRNDRNPVRVVAATALLCVCATGCSSATTPQIPRSNEPGVAPAPPPTTAAHLSEAERVQAFLDVRSKPSDVRYSFKSAGGQTIDCIDFFATPGVRALAERGEPITALPTPPPPARKHRAGGIDVVDRPQPLPASEGIDEDGHDRLCPAGTVSEVRITPEQIAWAGGLDAYLAAHRKHPPARLAQAASTEPAPPAELAQAASTEPAPPYGMWPCLDGEFHDYAHVEKDIVDNTPGITSAGTEMSVYAPSVPSTPEHSISQVWLFGGVNAIDQSGTCTSNCVQTLEVGWQVDYDVPNNTGVADGVNPYIFIYSTTNGYMSGCWNGDTTDTSDNNVKCPTFIPLTQLPSTILPGAKIPFNAPQTPNPSVPSTLPTEMHGTRSRGRGV